MSVGGEGAGIRDLQVRQGWVVEKSWLGYLHLVHWGLMGRCGYLHYLYSHVCYLQLCVYLQGRSM